MNDVTRILSQLEGDGTAAAKDLLPLVYEELRRLADARMRQEKPGQTLQATGLVHDAFIRLVDSAHAENWKSRAHFFAAASEAMRRILVDRARAKATAKRGGGVNRVPLMEDCIASDEHFHKLLAIDEALAELEQHDAIAAQLVKLRYFGGLSHGEAADVLSISKGTADRVWRLARAWLFRKLK